MRHAIETTGLRRIFGDKVAVDGLGLIVEPGTFFGFLGPNGAGKSTTIKMLTGLLEPTSGVASILGHDVVGDAVRAKQLIGVVPEETALFDRLTGPEQLRFVGRMYGMERAVIESRTEELLAATTAGNFVSPVLPVARDISKIGNLPSQTRIFVSFGMLIVNVIVIGGLVLIAALAGSPWLQSLLLMAYLFIQIAVYRTLLGPAAQLLERRKETLIEALKVPA